MIPEIEALRDFTSTKGCAAGLAERGTVTPPSQGRECPIPCPSTERRLKHLQGSDG